MKSTVARVAISLSIVLLLGACSVLWQEEEARRGVSSSLVEYLYPDGKTPPEFDETVPHLRLPLSVGLAFVPSNQRDYDVLSEGKKMKMLEEVKSKFSDLDYVGEITIIPDTYMRSSKGFVAVDQVARLYNLDVVALVSYDQVTVTSGRKSSLLYWTVVGAYLVKGSNNEATTFVDTAIFDVKSRKLLLRAPGVSEMSRNSTAIESDHVIRETRGQSFDLAMADMSKNLDAELVRFKERIKQDKSVQVSSKKGYSGRGGGGGGALGWPLVVLLSGLALFRGVRLSAPRQ